MNHTQTPWIVKSIDEGESIRALEQSGNAFGIHDPEGIYFAFCLDDMGREEANAAYIVQAVNSHEAMLEALAWIAEHDREFGDIEDSETMVHHMTSRAKEALAKAKGGQP